MRYLACLAIILLGCKGSPEPKNQVVVEEKPPFLSDSKSNLFFHVCPDLRICNPTAFVLGDTLKNEDYSLTYQYQLETDTTIASLRMMVSFTNQEAYQTYTNELQEHLDRFSNNHSSSKNFETWILPLYNRPLIEVDVFTDDNKKHLRIELVKRQYV